MDGIWRELLRRAYKNAALSHDSSTQIGALLVNSIGSVLAEGINEFPQDVKETLERWERPIKYKFVEHAERNAIYAAAHKGIKTVGLTMVCTWGACTDCARAIIQAGIKCLVTHKQAHDRSPERWVEEINIAFTMLKESGVKIVKYDGKIGATPKILQDGDLWTP